MCWILTALGAVMLAAGTFLIIRFFTGHGTRNPLVAAVGRVEYMVLGVLLTSIGFLLFALGLTETVCRGLGID
jgi:hypothetical protein